MQLSSVCICRSYKIFIENIHFAKTTKAFNSQLFTILISYNASIFALTICLRLLFILYINFYMYMLRAKSARHADAVLSVQCRIKCWPFNSTTPDGHQHIHNHNSCSSLVPAQQRWLIHASATYEITFPPTAHFTKVSKFIIKETAIIALLLDEKEDSRKRRENTEYIEVWD